MARPTLSSHPKFARLASMVGGRSVARGALELVWEVAYASGEPLVGDAAAVEFIADWRGKKGTLAAAMVSCRFLEETPDGLIVHDLEDHAPEYVLKRWEREAERRSKGQTIRAVRQAAARARWAALPEDGDANGIRLHPFAMQMHANGEQVSTNVTPPAPAPAPAPKNSPPARDPRAPEPEPLTWSGEQWRQEFAKAWSKDNADMPYGRGAGDGKSAGTLSDMLAGLPLPARLDAQARAPRMFAEFLADRSPKAVAERHQFSYFVLLFNGLRSDRKQAARGSPALPRIPPRPDPEQEASRAAWRNR